MYHFQENDETSDPRSAYLALHKISHFSKTSASFLIYSLSYANKSLCSLIFCPVSYKLMPCHSFLYVSLSFHNQTPINFQRSWKRYFSRPKKKEKKNMKIRSCSDTSDTSKHSLSLHRGTTLYNRFQTKRQRIPSILSRETKKIG